jgi:hypothetical protein
MVAAAICLVLSLATVGSVRAQEAQETTTAASDSTLIVSGDVTQPLTIKPADLKTMPRTTVTVSDEGRQINYEGLLVGEQPFRSAVVSLSEYGDLRIHPEVGRRRKVQGADAP